MDGVLCDFSEEVSVDFSVEVSVELDNDAGVDVAVDVAVDGTVLRRGGIAWVSLSDEVAVDDVAVEGDSGLVEAPRPPSCPWVRVLAAFLPFERALDLVAAGVRGPLGAGD